MKGHFKRFVSTLIMGVILQAVYHKGRIDEFEKIDMLAEFRKSILKEKEES